MTGQGFDLPRGEVFAIDAVDLRLDPAPHPYVAAHGEAIAAHWRKEHGANPALFDGPVAFFSSLRLEGRRLEGRFHIVGFSAYLHWRATPRDAAGMAPAEHCFAHAMPVASDGALLAVRMGAHTANPGKVYFAAGSFDPHDIVDRRLDVEGNMRREVREETGLDLSMAAAEPGCYGWSRDGRTVIFRRYRLELDSHELARRVEAFVAAEADPEIDGPVMLRGPGDLPAATLTHMPAMVAWHFAQGG